MADVIGFDPVAWSVDGGRHNGDLLRLVAYAATSGEEGIITPGDCRVHALTVPGNQIVIDTGALIIKNRSSGVRNQSYVANARNESRLDVTPTDASGGRSDLVCVRVEDPQFPGWPKPSAADAPNYQYTRPFVLTNVPPTTTRFDQLQLGTPYSAYALARIDIPANTGTITDQMVKPLRAVANPRTKRKHERLDGPVGQIDFNDQYRSLWNWPTVDVPPWATEAIIRTDMAGVMIRNAAFAGFIRGNIGSAFTRSTYINEQIFGDSRRTYFASDTIAIPAALRGTRQDFFMSGVRNGGTGILLADSGTQLIFDVEFIEGAS